MSTPTLATVIRKAIESRLADVHVSIPGRVERYDASRRAVDVQPLVKRGRPNEVGQREITSLPVVPNVPLMFVGSTNHGLTWPVEAGDTVLLIFSESSLDVWLDRGGEVDPLDDRRFSLSDAVAIPGVQSFAQAKAASADATVLESSARVDVVAPTVNLGDTGGAGVVTQVALDAFMTALGAAILALPGIEKPPLQGLQTALTNVNWPSLYVSSQVKAV